MSVERGESSGAILPSDDIRIKGQGKMESATAEVGSSIQAIFARFSAIIAN
jgi:hypothetical protein